MTQMRGAKGSNKYPFLPPDPEVGWVPYVWLVYMVWFMMFPFLGRVASMGALADRRRGGWSFCPFISRRTG